MTSDTDLLALAEHVLDLLDTVVADRAPAASVEANVTAARTHHGLTRFANSFVHQHVTEDTHQVTITVAVDGRTATASTTSVDDASIRGLLTATISSARLQPLDPYWPGATPAEDLVVSSHADDETTGSRPDTRAGIVKAFVDAGEGLSAAGFVDSEARQVAMASTAGQRVSARTTRATIDGIHQTAASAGAASQTSRSLDELDGARAGSWAADLAHRSARFVDLDPGDYEVVLAPEAVATVLIFLAVFGFNGKAALEGQSFVRPGEQQLDAGITVDNDPADPRTVGLPFDAEGTPRRPYPLVEQGVSRGPAHDRRTAKRAESTSTGDAMPGNVPVGPVPTTVVMPPGDLDPHRLVADVRRGLLVTQFHYCRVLDPKTLVVTGLTRNGTFLVEGGQIMGAVGNLRFTQSFVDALGPGRLLGVGDDDRHAVGEFGPGMVICPSLHLGRWTFTGGSQG